MLGFPHSMEKDFDRFHKAVDFIDSLGNLPLFPEYMESGEQSHPEIYLKRMRYFLKLLGNPEKNFKFVHVTGTAGKGTVATMIHNSLVASGKKCGLFTSPYVVSATEKIQVGDWYIGAGEFADLVEVVKPVIDTAYISGEFGRPSHFEIYFALALLYFKQKKCEWAVLEVGCGGRYDATNIIKSPEASAVTCIDYDHTEILGSTLKVIAYDKAGIIKRGSKFFTTEKRPALRKIFERVCGEEEASFEAVFPAANGDSNKLLAETILRSLGVSEVSIRKGITRTKLPARFEVVSRKPLVIIDGAHNRSKMAHTVALLKKEKFGKLFLIIGIADNKDSHDIFQNIIPLADEIFFTRFASRDRKPAPPLRLLKESKRYLKPSAKVKIYLDSSDALAAACDRLGKDDCLLATGSFFLAGELRKRWFPEGRILKGRRSF
ncbi:MAG: FolC bifunctional protein [Candidatus Magasanikbacteria bacterium GW2011_GWA2_46_17]|uniref:tetrahydrofolate synthase n=1 Tax=Candidatus Magasanikbacteria bacterium GW2011_GWA2_46_17 TaxID=1619042 RepID=A0A0G1S193_9BACT|nr:MAG: FolC bifunctional protein [Candidatus Magasanikbacteria bacterium GW2011_GWA2_46_17]